MCLKDVVRVDRVEIGAAIGSVEGRRVGASLVLFDSDDVHVAPGDWIVVHTGIAVDKLTPAEADRILRARNAEQHDHSGRS